MNTQDTIKNKLIYSKLFKGIPTYQSIQFKIKLKVI